RYITLEEVAAMIRAGAEARVVDAKSGEDLTQATLVQIIMEGRNAGALLPVPLLVQLIRMEEGALAEFLGRFLSSALDIYLQARQGAQVMAPFNPFAMTPFGAADALARFFNAAPWGGGRGAAPAPTAAAAPPAAAPAAASGDADVAELRRELDSLKE